MWYLRFKYVIAALFVLFLLFDLKGTAGSPPVVFMAENYTQEEVPVSGNLNDFAFDPDGGALSFTLLAPATKGVLDLNPNGSYTFYPFVDVIGIEYIPFRACDSEGLCTDGLLEMAIFFVNDPPVCIDDLVTVPSGGTVTGNVQLNDIELDNEPIYYTVLIGTQTGTFSMNINGAFTYTAPEGYTGTVTITMMGCDPCNACDLSVLTIQVVAPSDPPVAVNDFAEGNEEDVITGNLALNDVYNGSGVLTYTVAQSPAHGLLVLNANGTFTYTPDINYWGSDQATYQVCNAVNQCSQATIHFEVYFVNDPPIAVDDYFTLNEDEAYGDSVADNDIEYDFEPLIYIIIQNVAHGTLNLTSNGQFAYTPAANYNGTDLFIYAAIDPCGAMDFAVAYFTILPVNDTPVCVNDTKVLNEDTVATGTVTSNDYDVDGDVLSFTVISEVQHGVLLMNTDGGYTYTPNADFNGTDVATYRATDPSGAYGQATVTFTILPVNDAPVCVNDFYTTSENLPIAGDVSLNDYDVDDNALIYSIINGPANGVLDLQPDGSFIYTPDNNFSGWDYVQYLGTDAQGATGSAILSIEVGAVNDPPVLANAEFVIDEDNWLEVSVSNLASDPDGDPLEFSLLSATQHGTISITPQGWLQYIPNANYNGTDQFLLMVSDPDGLTAAATYTIHIMPVNDLPVVFNAFFELDEDGMIAGAVGANDYDVDGDMLEYALLNEPLIGQILMNANGSFIYTTTPDAFGTEWLTYTVTDGNGSSVQAMLQIVINPVNDVPVVMGEEWNILMDNSLNGDVSLNDYDVEDALLSYTLIQDVAAGLLVFNANGTFSYTPPDNFSGDVEFTYQACDSENSCAQAVVLIHVLFMNTAPVAQPDGFTINEDTALNGNVSLNDMDAEGDLLTFNLLSEPSNGNFIFNSNGTFSYQPASNYFGTEVMWYQVCDSYGACAETYFEIEVLPVNDAPVATGETYNSPEDTFLEGTVAGNDYDVDDALLTYSVSTGTTNGVFSMLPNGTFTYMPGLNYNGTQTVTYSVCDSQGLCATAQLILIITPVNDPPVVNGETKTGNEDTVIIGTVASNDYDPEFSPLTYSIVTPPSLGVFNLNTNGLYNYTPPANFNGTVYVVYQACDPGGLCGSATLTINVLNINDLPVGVNDYYQVEENTVFTANVGDNDYDIDIEPLFFSLLTATSNGSLSLEVTGDITYTPNLNFIGTDQALYMVCDSCGACAVATMYFNVFHVNLPPLAADDYFVTNINTTLDGQVGVNDSDAEGDALLFDLISFTEHGAISFNSDGSFSYTPSADYLGEDSFTYSVCDVNGACAQATVHISVELLVINTPPVVSPIAVNLCSSQSMVLALDEYISDEESPNDDLIVSITEAPENLCVLLPGRLMLITPDLTFTGDWDIQFEVCDVGVPVHCTSGVLHIEVTADSEVVVEQTIVQDVLCAGESNGSIELIMPADGETYEFNWSHGPHTQNVTGLVAGIYSVIVQSNAQCKTPLELAVEVSEPEELLIEGLAANPIDEDEGGSGPYTITGGTPPYIFQWFDSNGIMVSAEMQLSGLLLSEEAGEYSLLVTDANGCSVSGSIVVTGVEDAWAESQVSLYPNPAHESMNLLVNLPYADVLVCRVLDATGREVMNRQFNYASGSMIHTIPVSALGSGSYLLLVQGERGALALRFEKL